MKKLFANRISTLLNNLKGSYYYGFAAILDRLTFFLLFSAIGHLFGSQQLGSLSAALNLSNILLLVSDIGLPVLLQKESSVKYSISELLSISIVIKLFLSIFVFIGVIAFYCFYKQISFFSLSFYFIICILYSLSNLILSVIIGKHKDKLYFSIYFTSRISMLFGILALIIIKNTDLIFFIIAIGGLTQLLLTLRKKFEIIKFSLVTIAKIKNIIKISYPIGLGLLFVFAYDKIDVLIITIYKGTREGGTYYAAYAIMKSFTILTSFYLIKYFSHLSNYYNKDKAIYKQLVLQSLTISFVIAISLIAGFQFYSAQIIKLFFGNSFINSGPLLKILSFAIFFMIINYNLGTILNSMDRFNAPMVGGVISLFVNVTLNLLFVPKYGYYASSYITIVTEITMLCYYLFEFLRLYNKKILNG